MWVEKVLRFDFFKNNKKEGKDMPYMRKRVWVPGYYYYTRSGKRVHVRGHYKYITVWVSPKRVKRVKTKWW